jgi:dipeptidyl aminopeptidase/acylaminoacyl peptidase
MNATMRRRVVAGICLLGAVLATNTFAADDSAPALTPRKVQTRRIIGAMLRPNGYQAMRLAPDGKHLAAIEWSGFSRSLLLIDADTFQAHTLVPATYRPGWSTSLQPLDAHWISNDTLAVDFNDGDCAVVGFDGRRGRVIGDHFVRMIESDKPGEPAQWAIVGEQGIFQSTNVHRVNVLTGEKVDVPIGLPGDLVNAVFDHGGHLRAATTRETKWLSPGAKITNWYRHDEHSPWQQLAQAATTQELWQPLGVPDDTDKLVVLSREGRDTRAMYGYDVARRSLTDLRVGHATEDLIDVAEDSGQNVIRAMTHGLKPKTYWFDERWDQLQRSIDKALPDAVNVLRGDPHGRVLVWTYSDRDPGRWLLLDTTNWSLRSVAASKLNLDLATMRPMQTLTYDADDGLKIPAYLTLPDGPATPRPMVVYIHGGPMARDEWAWDFDVQVLAAAGYAVFQPQFRGSAGFGRKFEEAGYRQWGLAMQDDITAGVKAMIARGVADPARICIYGASYGGYAALWGLVKTPALYRCGISLAGVTDIGERFTDWSDTNASKEGQEWLRFAVGDRQTMAAQFDAVSPEKHAAQIHVPVLLGHGTDDRRVPIGHSKRMAKALTAAHGSVETHWYDDEGHGLSRIGDIRDFEAAMIDFLDRNIGPASGAAAGDAAAADASAARPPQ